MLHAFGCDYPGILDIRGYTQVEGYAEYDDDINGCQSQTMLGNPGPQAESSAQWQK